MYHKNSKYPSVTDVLSPYSGYDAVPEKYLTIAAERGELVHSYCAAYAKGEWTPMPRADLRGYVDSFKKWFDSFVDEVLLVEEELEHDEFKYCGHPDLLVVSRRLGGIVLPDIKTPIAVKKVWGSQLAAYDKLIEKNKKITIGRIGSLRLNQNGDIAKFDEFTEFRGSYFSAFYGALIAYHFFKG